MAIELEKILTISARDYCEINGKDLNEYEAKGVHFNPENDLRCGELTKSFAKIVQKEAEVIVDYRVSVGGAG